jgi:hypothetical protein
VIILLTIIGVTYATNVYECNEGGVITTIHETEDGFSWSIVDHSDPDTPPELVGSGYTAGASYSGTCPQIA